MRESSWDQLMLEKGRKQHWAEGHTGRPLSIKPQAVMSATAGTHSRVVSSWGRDESLDAGHAGEGEAAVSS